MPLPDSTTRAFAEEISTLRRDVNALQKSQRSAQLGQSTIDDGAIGITKDGVQRGSVGITADGSFAVVSSNAPPPPAPSQPSVTPIATGVMVGWDGNFAGAARPQDFLFVEIWHNTTNNFASAILDGNMTDPGDWPVAPLSSGGVHYFWLVAVNTSQKRSGPSAVASATPEMVVAQALLDGIVTELKVANNAISQNKIALSAVGTGQIAGNAVDLSKLANGSVNATKLVNGAVTQPAIATDAVTANAIAANSIIAGKIAADSVTANNLVANSVGTSELVANAVTSDKIISNAITADKIQALAITADKIAVNAINAGHISAGSITSAKLASTLILGTTIIAGTSTTGARIVLNSGGIEGYRSNGVKTLDFDNATGNITIAGQYRSADGGSRVEINPGGGAPKEVRFYQDGNDWAMIYADDAPNGTAAVVGASEVENNRRGSFGCYPTEAFIAYQPPSGASLSAFSATNGQANVWSNGNINLDIRNSNGRVDFTHARGGNARLEYRSTGNAEPQFFSPNRNMALTWVGGNIGLYVGNNNGDGFPITASEFKLASGRRAKKRERDVELSLVGSPRDGVHRIKSKMWNYTHERLADEVIPTPKRSKRFQAKRDAQGKITYDPTTKLPAYDEITIEEQIPVVSKSHLFPIAEDLQALLPELVTEAEGVEGGLLVDLRDVVGYLWLVNTEQERELRRLANEVDKLKDKK